MLSAIAPRSRKIARHIRAALVTVLLASASGGIWAAIEPDRGVLAAFSALQAHIAAMRNDEAPVPTDGLLKTIGAARGAYSRGDVCTAAALLERFMNEVAAPRGERSV